MDNWEPPIEFKDEKPTLEKVAELIRYHSNKRSSAVTCLRQIIMICKEYEFDVDMHGHGGSSSTGNSLSIIRNIFIS